MFMSLLLGRRTQFFLAIDSNCLQINVGKRNVFLIFNVRLCLCSTILSMAWISRFEIGYRLQMNMIRVENKNKKFDKFLSCLMHIR